MKPISAFAASPWRAFSFARGRRPIRAGSTCASPQATTKSAAPRWVRWSTAHPEIDMPFGRRATVSSRPRKSCSAARALLPRGAAAVTVGVDSAAGSVGRDTFTGSVARSVASSRFSAWLAVSGVDGGRGNGTATALRPSRRSKNARTRACGVGGVWVDFCTGSGNATASAFAASSS